MRRYIALIDRIYVIRDVDTDPTTIKTPVLVLGASAARQQSRPLTGRTREGGEQHHGDESSVRATHAGPESSEGAGDGLPTYTHHGWRYLTADPVNNKLAVAIGAPCNVPWREGTTGGVENCANQGASNPFPLLSTIATLDPTGANFQVVARGVRNSVGITFHPVNNEMWFTVRDELLRVARADSQVRLRVSQHKALWEEARKVGARPLFCQSHHRRRGRLQLASLTLTLTLTRCLSHGAAGERPRPVGLLGLELDARHFCQPARRAQPPRRFAKVR